MKFRFSLNVSTRHRELLVYSQKNEVLNPKQVSWVCGRPHRVFIPASCYSLKKAEKSVISYDVHGFVSLKKYIRKHVITGSEYVSMLTDLACAYGCCTFGPDRQFWQRSLLFDSRYVFVNAASQLRFVFIPFDEIPFVIESSPLYFLRLLSDTKKLNFATPTDIALAQRLASFVLNERDAFSFNAYRGFLRRECGIEVDPNGNMTNHANELKKGVLSSVDFDSKLESQAILVNGTAAPSVSDLVGQVVPTPFYQKGMQYMLCRVSTGETYRLWPNQPTVIGRGSRHESRCDIRITGNQKISREHALIVVADDTITLTDLGSTNGTYVNGHCLKANKPIRVTLDQHFYLWQEEFAVRRG